MKLGLMQVVQTHDFNKDSKLIALDLIWASTGFRIRPEKIKFGRAVHMDTRPDIDDDPDTFVEANVDSSEDARLGQGSGFMYQRLPLSSVRGFRNIRVYPKHGDTFKTSDILEEINSKLNVEFNKHDLLEMEYPGDAQTITVYADPGSWTWVGSVDIGVSDVKVEPLFRLRDLNGFHSVGNMAIQNPYKGESVARLVALMNETNGTNYAIDTDFTISTLGPTTGSDFRNSQFLVTPTSSEFEEQTLRFRRLSLSILNEVPQDTIRPVTIPQVPFSIHEILPEINDALGLDLTPDEVLDTEYTEFLGYYRLQIAGPRASFAWLESGYTFIASHEGVEQRYLEDGWPRFLEDGSLRLLEPTT